MFIPKVKRVHAWSEMENYWILCGESQFDLFSLSGRSITILPKQISIFLTFDRKQSLKAFLIHYYIIN